MTSTFRTVWVAAVVGVVLSSCSPAAPPPPTVAPWTAKQMMASFGWTGCSAMTGQAISRPPRPGESAETVSVATELAEIEGRIVSASPAFSFALPQGWRLARAADASRIDIYRPVVRARREFLVTMNPRRSPFVDALSDTITAATLMGRTPVVTDALGPYVAVVATEGPSAPYRRSDQLSARERESLWEDFSRAITERRRAICTPVLTLHSMDVTNYPDSAALIFVYTQDDPLGRLVCTRIQFISESATVTFEHAATAANPRNGFAGLEAMARSFRFAKP